MSAIAGLFVAVVVDDRPVIVQPRNCLAQEPRTAVLLGEAPDGLPLVLEVKRRSSVELAVLEALGCTRARDLPASVAGALEKLEGVVDGSARKLGIGKLEGRPAYITAGDLNALFGETLLARMLGSRSPSIVPDDRCAPSSEPGRVPITSAIAKAEKPKEIMVQAGRKIRLVIPLSDGRLHAAIGEGDAESHRPFRLEDLRILQSARFHWTDERGRQGEGPLADARAWEKAASGAISLAWSVSRADAARAILGLARGLQEIHRGGMVHCDVKPGNVLILSEGAVPNDAVLVRSGQVSAAATPGWAAPEQVLAHPVSPATDVYALGLLALALLRGAVHGEERSFIVPVGGTDRRRMRIIAQAEVFIDPTGMDLKDPVRRAWEDFLG